MKFFILYIYKIAKVLYSIILKHNSNNHYHLFPDANIFVFILLINVVRKLHGNANIQKRFNPA
jgi:hypothetical protein